MSDPANPSGPAPIELLRAQLVGDELHCALGSELDIFDDGPGAWGGVLAHLARAVAQSLASDDGLDQDKILEDICDAFNQELNASHDPDA
jgi:hypothetical protein